MAVLGSEALSSLDFSLTGDGEKLLPKLLPSGLGCLDVSNPAVCCTERKLSYVADALVKSTRAVY